MHQQKVQLRILAVAACLFLAVGGFVVPAPHRPMALLGAASFAFMWWGSQRIAGAPSGPEVGAICFLNAFAFLIFVAKDVQGSHWLSFLTGCFGALIATGLWVVQRFHFHAPTPVPLPSRILQALRAGALGATVLSIIATLPLLGMFLSDPSHRADTIHFALLVYGAYFSAGLGVGLMVGLLLPIAHWALGRLLLGFMGGVALYAAVGPAVALIDRLEAKPPTETPVLIGIAMLAGLVVGPGGAFSFGDQDGPAA
jgi:hypothetical protein